MYVCTHTYTFYTLHVSNAYFPKIYVWNIHFHNHWVARGRLTPPFFFLALSLRQGDVPRASLWSFDCTRTHPAPPKCHRNALFVARNRRPMTSSGRRSKKVCIHDFVSVISRVFRRFPGSWGSNATTRFRSGIGLDWPRIILKVSLEILCTGHWAVSQHCLFIGKRELWKSSSCFLGFFEKWNLGDHNYRSTLPPSASTFGTLTNLFILRYRLRDDTNYKKKRKKKNTTHTYKLQRATYTVNYNLTVSWGSWIIATQNGVCTRRYTIEFRKKGKWHSRENADRKKRSKDYYAVLLVPRIGHR